MTELEESQSGERIINELGRFTPREILVNAQCAKLKGFRSFVEKQEGTSVKTLKEGETRLEDMERVVTDHFDRSLEELELTSENGTRALGMALSYLFEVQKTDLQNIREIQFYSDSKYMKLDFSARRNLELTETLRNREKRGTLLWVLDKTRTAMGKRLLRAWVEQPLLSPGGITERQNAVQFLVNDLALRDEIADYMTSIHDMERLITRISYGSANARELRSLYETVQCLLPIKLLLEGAEPRLMQRIEENIDPLEDIMALIEESIAEDPPFTVREGGMIKEGYSPELDELRDIVANGQGYLATIEAQERERTGIPNVPEEWIRKQTLTNAERYITGELKELESKVLGAQERITKLEYELFCGVRETVSQSLVRIQQTSHAVATLDVLCSFAKVAVDNGYVCPEITEDGSITIKDGRHPVVEKMLDGAPFVPNDTALDLNDAQASIITGPNMAGKSTYMRQVALIVLMAQTGCFVPAASARISICDAIFTRVGASDDLASGQSTFMVEMTEVASILKNATRQSLIILDEIGRGTSTFDGMAIAKAVLEYVCNKRKIGAKTLFATHYHELTDMEEELPGIRNYNIACKKRGDDIIFLRRIVPGPADGSYGIEVAKLAGVPNPVVKRAREVLKEIIEEQERTGGVLKVPTEMPAEADGSPEDFQISFTSHASDEILDELKALDVNTFTPIEAMNYLYDLSKRAKES